MEKTEEPSNQKTAIERVLQQIDPDIKENDDRYFKQHDMMIKTSCKEKARDYADDADRWQNEQLSD